MPLLTIRRAEPPVAKDIEAALLADLRQTAPQGRNETITLSVNAADGRLVAGLVGSTSYGWLLIKVLWVTDEQRRQGYGRALVLNAFNHAKSLGCHGAWLDTFHRTVRAMPEVVSAYRMTGDLDYVLRVRVADVPAYDAFYKRLTSRISLSDVSASFVMEEIKETTAVPL